MFKYTLISQEENYFGPKDEEKHKLLLTAQTGLSIDCIFTFDLLPLQESASNLNVVCSLKWSPEQSCYDFLPILASATVCASQS